MSNLNSIKARFGIVGMSPQLDNALETATRVAPTDLTVLIMGESGVGKEVFSKVIHSLSARKHRDFIAVNCGAIPEGTINSELFGHEKGSFTGAVGERKGYFETVSGGTIFLDEIGEMPLDTQSFLLRVLESGEFIRVGSSKVERTDVRVVAATNVDLEERVRRGKFREDLFYRLSTVPIKVPALKDRRDDIHILFRKFAVDFAEKYRMQPVRLDDLAQRVLENYRWPGNIRELKNVAEQLSVLSEERLVTADTLQNLLPQMFQRNLPGTPGRHGFDDEKQSFSEREIMYKLLWDMTNDLKELKAMFYELVRSNNLRMPDSPQFSRSMQPSLPAISSRYPMAEHGSDAGDYFIQNENQNFYSIENEGLRDNRAFIVEPNKGNVSIDQDIEAEEVLAMDEIEKEAIKRALKKYNGRRKEAAEELRISERTLYRKIKQYNLG